MDPLDVSELVGEKSWWRKVNYRRLDEEEAKEGDNCGLVRD